MAKKVKQVKKAKKKSSPKAVKKTTKDLPSLDLISSLIVILEHIENALEQHNFNLAEVWVDRYVHKIPEKLVDTRLMKALYNSMKNRDAELLDATAKAELERIRTIKIKVLRDKITHLSFQ